jgi:acetolactate synthase-1/2/3 large subunit
MGYGVPAAVAAKLVHSDRIVVCFSGDGDFLMSGQELATAVQYELPVVILVVNNGMYGTIRMHQERQFPGEVYGTDLVNGFHCLRTGFGPTARSWKRRLRARSACARVRSPGRPRVAREPGDHAARTLSQIRAGRSHRSTGRAAVRPEHEIALAVRHMVERDGASASKKETPLSE